MDKLKFSITYLGKSLVLSILLSASAVSAQNTGIQASILPLEESVRIAVENNLQVRQSELRSESAWIQLRQSRTDRLPSITGSVNHGLNQGRSIDPFTNSYIDQNISFANYGLSGGITLFNGLLLQNQIKQNSLAFEAAKMERQQAVESLTLDVMLAYLEILSNQELLTQAQLQANLTKQQVDRLGVLDKQGAIAPSLLYDLEGQYARDQLAIVNQKNALNSSRLALFQLMNINYDRNVNLVPLSLEKLSPAKYNFDQSQIISAAFNQLALTSAASLRTQSAEQALRASRSLMFPTLSLNSNLFSNYSSLAYRNEFLGIQQVTTDNYVTVNGSQYPVTAPERSFSTERIQYNDQLRNNFSSSFSLNLRIPIFNSVYAKSRISQARVELKNAELIEENISIQLKQAVEQAYFNMEAAWERLEAAERQAEAFRKAFTAAEVRFSAGAGTSVDYSIAKTNSDQAAVGLINARYDYLLRTKVLDYYRGELELR